MKVRNFTGLLVLVVIILFSATNVMSADYEAMQGAESADVVFDFRIGDPGTALGHLNLIHTMVNDSSMLINGSKPEIVIVFIGPSVKLVSTDKSGFEKDQQEQIDSLAGKISSMNQDGIKFEICMAAAHAFEVDPDTILPMVSQVANGWISVIGYQQRGYALVADF